MGVDTGKNNKGKVLVMKENNLSKENKEELNEKQDTNTKIQFNMKETKDITIDFSNRIDDRCMDDPHQENLSFLHTSKLKADASLQDDSWLYNETTVLKKKVGDMEKEME